MRSLADSILVLCNVLLPSKEKKEPEGLILHHRFSLIKYSGLVPQTGVKQESTDVSERDKHSRLQAPSSSETAASSKCRFGVVFFFFRQI